ncbi:isoaspartyl peptidase/L-asparaginase family protein [Qipengyuania vesicularis]|uniref:isoaspartyl peptidase/L-asparaginase family protein n=1 Tax=Qipengyuania vesicularis TaxID=2867232 RepID=UPI001C87D0B2|nr:isoaspartyl peptidase/L-asparaginase [Qipengyuania vesicularis]MBX7526492.1 isoaspartyl peptidase/L-asparaginase [Qipengyuania vesicularis]
MSHDHVIALHGGAGVNPERDYAKVETHLSELVDRCEQMLAGGETALDTVEFAVAEMEDSGLYVAGRGSAPNDQGVVECDAAIMDGARLRAGGICAAVDVAQPIRAAREVLENTPYVLLAGDGANAFARERGLEMVSDPVSHFVLPVGVEAEELLKLDDGLAHGTVGAVALDRNGQLASATSTGGLLGKRAGRVGDTPITGIGNWADEEVAVSCTGIGEAFIYAGGARDLASRMAYAGQSLEDAGASLLAEVARHRGDGGLIAVHRTGEVIMPFNSAGMKRAVAGSRITRAVAIL